MVLPVGRVLSVCVGCALSQALTSSLAQALDINLGGQVIGIRSTLASAGDVADVWAAMQLSGSLERHMQSVAGESQAK